MVAQVECRQTAHRALLFAPCVRFVAAGYRQALHSQVGRAANRFAARQSPLRAKMAHGPMPQPCLALHLVSPPNSSGAATSGRIPRLAW